MGIYFEGSILEFIQTYIHTIVRHTIEIVYLTLHQYLSLITTCFFLFLICFIKVFNTLTHIVKLLQFLCYSTFREELVQFNIVRTTYSLPTILVFFGQWTCFSKQFFTFTHTIHNLYLWNACSCKVRDKGLKFKFSFFLHLLTEVFILNVCIISKGCRRCCKTHILCIHAKGEHNTAKKHRQFSCTCTCIGVCLIDGYPTKALFLRINKIFITLAQQNILQHSRVSKKNVRSSILTSYVFTSIDHSVVLILLIAIGIQYRLSLTVSNKTTDHVYLSTSSFCVI